MPQGLKYTKDLVNSIQALKNKTAYLAKEFTRLLSEKASEQIQKFYDDAISKLTEEIKTLPIGYRYTGTFYLKKSYITPTQVEKLEGSAFVCEDLISWQIENIQGHHPQFYYRTLYKDPELKVELTKKDAVPVYAES